MRIRMVCTLLATLAPTWALAGDWMSEEDHFELAAGFLAGSRSYGDAPFSLQSAGVDGVAGLQEPFDGVPYDDAAVFGLRAEGRVVLSHIRMTLGYQRPYPTWDGLAAVDATDAIGGLHPSISTGLSAHEIRFGLGVEAPAGPVAPFADLVGDVHILDSTLAVDGETAELRSESFSLAARGGLRAQVSDYVFVETAGEYGLTGPNRWGAQLMVGFAFM